MSTEDVIYMIVDTDSDDADYSPNSSLSEDSDILTEELDSSGTETDEDASDVPPLSNSDNDNDDGDNDNNSNDEEEMSSEQTESNSGSPEPQELPHPEFPVSLSLENVLPLPVPEASAQPSEKVGASVKHPSPKRDFLSQSVDDDGQMCTICFEPWTNSSDHRLVSLKCGHLFGQSCITRWLKSSHKSKCPQCNTAAKKTDIRPIYARTLKVLDTSERDRALQQLEQEIELKGKLQIEFTQMKLKYQMANQECERLKKELIETKTMLREYRSTQRPSDRSTQPTKHSSQFTLLKNVELCKQGGCRIMDSCDLLGMLVISQPSTNNLFKGFGLRKISTIELKTSEFVCVHQKAIKDVCFHSHDGLILSASLDKTVKLTSVLSNSVVQSYSLGNDVWSCTWNKDDPRYFYAGVRNGCVFEFDMRVTTSHVSQLPSMGQTSPVVSLQYLSKLQAQSNSKNGPIVGHLSGCCFYEKDDRNSVYKLHPLPLEGNFTSLSCDQETGRFLASCRPSLKHAQVTHTLCSLSFDENSPVPCSCDRIQTMYGGNTQVQLAKSKVFPHPNNNLSMLVCSGDEDAQGALLWNGSSGECIQVLKADSPVLDLTMFKINHQPMLATLTERNLRFYSWTTS